MATRKQLTRLPFEVVICSEDQKKLFSKPVASVTKAGGQEGVVKLSTHFDSSLLLSALERSLLAGRRIRRGALYVSEVFCARLENRALYAMLKNVKLPAILTWNASFYSETLGLIKKP